MSGDLAGGASPRRSDAAWDAFVEGAPNGAYPQLSAWAEVKRVNGWRAARVTAPAGSVAAGASPALGAQVLMHAIGPSPWSVGYAPRGPVRTGTAGASDVAAFTDAVRELARSRRLSHVTVDPEVEAGDPMAGQLRAAGWRPGAAVQPDRSRILDLTQTEDALWSDLRSKWRQYVHKARRGGIAVTESDGAGLDEFYAIYRDTARRAGFVYRAASAYSDVYRAYAARGAARLLFARTADGEPVATLMLVRCGARVIEPYGGMTPAGAASRANYLLKWEAIRTSRHAGAATYDMWGLSHPGIEQFKAGFGGRDVRYIGAWELVTQRLVHTAVGAAHRAQVLVARRRQGVARSADGPRTAAGTGL